MTPVTNRPRWITWTGGGLIAYAALFTLYTLLQPLGETGRLIVGDIVYIPSSLVAGILSLLILRVTDNRPLRWAWGLIGLGFISWAIADSLWAWEELALGILPTSPDPTDIFYLLMYPLFFAGLLVYPTARWDRLSRTKLLLDASVTAIAAGMFSWHTFIAPTLSAESDSLLGRVIEVAYPIADLILLWGLLRIYFATPPAMTRAPIVMLTLGIGLNVIADIWYATLSAYDLYYTGHIVDALWVIGSVIAAGAALAQYQALRSGAQPVVASVPPTGMRRSQHLLPYLALVAAMLFLALTMYGDQSSLPQWGLLAGASLITVLILIRQVITLSEYARLNAALAQRVEEVTRLNEQVQRANEELKALDRLKSEFISSVSHDLRTPLTAILGYSELLLEESEAPLTPFQEESLRLIMGSGQRLLRLVDDLLDASRLEAGRFSLTPAEVAPAPLLRRLAREMHLQAEQKGLHLQADVPEGLPTLRADSQRLAQVLTNLLSNAIKFTPAGGQVRLTGYVVERRDGVAKLLTKVADPLIPALPEGKWLVVCVQDTGMGIAPEELPHLFSRFYRAAEAQRRAIHGTGLGLYVSKAIVEAHGGHIGVESRPGQGSRFWFALPLQDGTAKPPSTQDQKSHPEATAPPSGQPVRPVSPAPAPQ